MALVSLAVGTELTATLLLAPIGTSTLATEFWSRASSVAYGAAAPYALALIAALGPGDLAARAGPPSLRADPRRPHDRALRVTGLTQVVRRDAVLDGVDLEVPRRDHRGARAVRLRQDHAAAAGRRVPRARRRHDPARRPGGRRRAAGRCRRARRRVGYVPQEGALFPHLDVAAQHRLRAAARASAGGAGRVAEMLDLVELPRAAWPPATRTSCPAASSSGSRWPGRWRREPRVVLLDEPFSSLDAALREDTGRAVARALRASGADGRAGHPRPGRGAVAGRPGRGDGRRPVPPGRARPAEVYLDPATPAVAGLRRARQRCCRRPRGTGRHERPRRGVGARRLPTVRCCSRSAPSRSRSTAKDEAGSLAAEVLEVSLLRPRRHRPGPGRAADDARRGDRPGAGDRRAAAGRPRSASAWSARCSPSRGRSRRDRDPRRPADATGCSAARPARPRPGRRATPGLTYAELRRRWSPRERAELGGTRRLVLLEAGQRRRDSWSPTSPRSPAGTRCCWPRQGDLDRHARPRRRRTAPTSSTGLARTEARRAPPRPAPRPGAAAQHVRLDRLAQAGPALASQRARQRPQHRRLPRPPRRPTARSPRCRCTTATASRCCNSHLLVGAAVVLTDLSVADECFWELAERTRGSPASPGCRYTFDAARRRRLRRPRAARSLRYLTQAGGRMAPDRVREYAELGRERGCGPVRDVRPDRGDRADGLPAARPRGRPPGRRSGSRSRAARFRLAPVPDGAAGHVGELVYSGPERDDGLRRVAPPTWPAAPSSPSCAPATWPGRPTTACARWSAGSTGTPRCSASGSTSTGSRRVLGGRVAARLGARP